MDRNGLVRSLSLNSMDRADFSSTTLEELDVNSESMANAVELENGQLAIVDEGSVVTLPQSVTVVQANGQRKRMPFILRNSSQFGLNRSLRIVQPLSKLSTKGTMLVSRGTRSVKKLELKTHAEGYFKNSTIHGLQYVAERNRPICEKILWSLCCIAMATLAILLILPISKKYQETPQFTTIGDTNYPVWKINFPAVTICSNNKVYKHQLQQALTLEPWASYANQTGDPTQFMKDMLDILKTYIFFSRQSQDKVKTWPERKQKIVELFKGYIPRLLRNVMHRCQDMIVFCLWHGQIEDCTEMFEVRPTDSGFCCSFNAVKQSKQFLPPEDLFDLEEFDYDSYQARYNELAVNDYHGFKVLVHDPLDFPEVAGRGFAIGKGTVAYIGVEAEFTESTESVKKMTLERRNCLTPNDDNEILEKLDVFSTYSRPACLLECRAKHLDKLCGCLPYYYPNFGYAWLKETSCNATGLMCLAEEASYLNALDTGLRNNTSFVEGPFCKCPYNCDETTYKPELSQVQVQLRKNSPVFGKMMDEGGYFYKLQANIDEMKAANESEEKIEKAERFLANRIGNFTEDTVVVHVYFKSLGVVKFIKDELYSIIDLVAAFGGIIGLCMGCSLLSGLEFIYWFTLRLATEQWRIIKRRRENKRNKVDAINHS